MRGGGGGGLVQSHSELFVFLFVCQLKKKSSGIKKIAPKNIKSCISEYLTVLCFDIGSQHFMIDANQGFHDVTPRSTLSVSKPDVEHGIFTLSASVVILFNLVQLGIFDA